MLEIRFNVNKYVKVKLTDRGRAILKQRHDNLMAEYHSYNVRLTSEYTPKEEDSEGYSTWQLWHLFEAFGNHIWLGCQPPFEPNIIIVHEDN